MDFIRHLFVLNHDVIYFAYGLVFFILGLAIALQSRSYSRLDLARSLKWLAAFGFTHGLNEWGDLFIPIQANYLHPKTIEILHYFHLLLLSSSFAFLFEFGVALLNPLGRARWLRAFPAGLPAAWLLFIYFPLPSLVPDFGTWHNTANALARYFIGLPGGLIAAYGLRQHTYRRIVPLNVPHIVRMLRVAGVMLFLYALFGGLLPPAIPFFPGNMVNADTLQAAVGAPAPVFRSIIGLGLAIAIIRALEVFDVETERMIESMEQQQILIAERNRLARELHDGAIQKVYTAGLLVESAQKLASSTDDLLSRRLEKAENVLNDAISDLRRNLSELQVSSASTGDPFPLALQKLAQDPRFLSLIDVSLEIDLPGSATIAQIQEDHILAILNEALSNVVRHAHADKVKITARSIEGRLHLSVRDNGIGIPANVEAGYGLRNMRDRARLLGGSLEIDNLDGRGTEVLLDIPWKNE
ncbi:MAG TPA: sensor histidine kinase [Anaerolineales bacterium]|jgi:signal transduction histidine kinase|nr:sensor histidine kinase [Anaerolineales bacterium]